MINVQSDEARRRAGIRLWPGILLGAAVLLVSIGAPVLFPSAVGIGVLGGVAGGLAIFLWWLFFSRAPWTDRVGVIAVAVAAVLVTYRLAHPSIATGMMGMMLAVYSIPSVGLALVVAAAAGRSRAHGVQRVLLATAILTACGFWTILRTNGVTGGGGAQLAWRWTKTSEERLLDRAIDGPAVTAQSVAPASSGPVAPAPTPAGSTTRTHATPPAPDVLPVGRPADWPGFRGRDRDGVAHGALFTTDWSQSPPALLWRRPIGPGWSSFAVIGDLLYTQEQRGDDEIVACYRVSTGKVVWQHRDGVRFWESNGGAGPRATPTLSEGRVYAFGATGVLNALDATSGGVVWSRNVAADSGVKVPTWGFASSPLVVGDRVIVAAAGTLVGYDLATGIPRWVGPDHGGGYSSPHLATIDGVVQVLLLSDAGATSVAPSEGAVLWEYAWPGVTIVQPASLPDGILVSNSGATGGNGIRRLSIARGASGWAITERWTSTGLKPYFNDFVVHKGHAYGFDGNILACIDLSDGTRQWKGGRYGNGQLVLLPDQDALLVVSEDGLLALVGATPDQFRELARSPGIEGKTWNHPVAVGDILLVRNGEEMAAFRLHADATTGGR